MQLTRDLFAQDLQELGHLFSCDTALHGVKMLQSEKVVHKVKMLS